MASAVGGQTTLHRARCSASRGRCLFSTRCNLKAPTSKKCYILRNLAKTDIFTRAPPECLVRRRSIPMKSLLPRRIAMHRHEPPTRRNFLHRQSIALAALALGMLACDTLAAGTVGCAAAIRTGDELWLVSCRGLECGPAAAQAPRMHYWRYDAQTSWTSSKLSELTTGDDGAMVTVLFAHGNRIDSSEAFTKGWSAYWSIARGAERPVRFVIFSWPSETIRGPIVDARVKAWRTNICGYYMAWLVDKLQPAAPLSLMGHSYRRGSSPVRCTCWGADRSTGSGSTSASTPRVRRRTSRCWPRRSTTIGCCPVIITARPCRKSDTCC